MIVIEEKVQEKSTRIVPIACWDENGLSVVPSSCTWTLTNESGTVINSRTNVSLTPAATMYVCMTGLDLAILSAADDGRRRLTIKASYTSGTFGSCTLNEEIRFSVEKLVNVT